MIIISTFAYTIDRIAKQSQLIANSEKMASVIFARKKGIVREKVISCRDDRFEIDGTEYSKYRVGTTYQMLYLPEGESERLDELLAETGTYYETATLVTPGDRYSAYRAFELYGQNPSAAIFRLPESEFDDVIGNQQYYTQEVVDFLIDNFDVGGLKFEIRDISNLIG